MKRYYRNETVVDFQGKSIKQVKDSERIGCFSIILLIVAIICLSLTHCQGQTVSAIKPQIETKVPHYQVGEMVWLQVGAFICTGKIKVIDNTGKKPNYFINFTIMYCLVNDGRVLVQPPYHWVWRNENEIRKYK
jgi:hypothetical protein